MTNSRAALEQWFSTQEIDRIEAARKAVDAATGTIAYCVYENPFGKSGGIFAVAENYAQTLIALDRNVVLLSPYHTRLKSAPQSDDLALLGTCRVPFGGELILVELFEHIRKGVRWVLFRADGFFEADGGMAETDPYIYSTDGSRLLRDSLFASATIPRASAALNLTENLIFHVQDWELASVTLTAKQAILDGSLKSAKVILTSHNPYDQELLLENLRLITPRCHLGNANVKSTYQIMIPLMDAPITTVSQTFARELTSDALQTTYFAGHLQGVYRERGIEGVDNGLFGTPKPAYSSAAMESAQQGDVSTILEEMRAKRTAMLSILSEYTRDVEPMIWGSLVAENGRPLKELADDVPLFLMFGRLDPRQKGFDLLTHVIRELPAGTAKFVLTPIVAGAAQSFVDDLKSLTAECPGDVVVYPFRMQRGYLETMAGASFAVMPSLYEPFGGATEPYLQGTPVVARKTGGLVQQVRDLKEHGEMATGILFRETFEPEMDSWRNLLQDDSLQSREDNPLYRALIESLKAAILQAVNVYREEQTIYGRMLANLYEVATSFSWERAAEEYEKIYAWND